MRLGRQRDLGELAVALRFERGGLGSHTTSWSRQRRKGGCRRGGRELGGKGGSHELLGWGSGDSRTQGARCPGKGTQGWPPSGAPREGEGQVAGQDGPAGSKALDIKLPGWKLRSIIS